MGERTSYPHGQFNWVDLCAPDMDAAATFYSNLFGWQAQEQDTQGGPRYVCFQLDGSNVAGIGQQTDEMKASGVPPVWNSYINVDDVQATCEAAAAAGATVFMPPYQILSAGHMAMMQDPSGAVIAFWQKIDHIGADIVNVPNAWVWNELLTGDVDQAKAFYQSILGWDFEKEENSPNDYWMIKNNRTMNAGMMRMTDQMQGVPPHWSTYFLVEDVAASLEKAKGLGATVYREPFETSVGHIAVAADPQGASFQMIQMTVPADD